MIAEAWRGSTGFLPALLAAALLSCSSPVSWLDPSVCRFDPVPVDELPAELSFRARSRFEVRDQTLRVELVARSESDRLVVLGLTDYGVRLFAAEQRGRELSIDGGSRRERVLAGFAMDALHRAFWIQPPEDATPDPEQSAAQPEASVSWDWGDERVRQTRGPTGGRRRYESTQESVVATIDYPRSGTAGSADGTQAGVVVRNVRCGYEAVIVPFVATARGPH